MNQQRVDHGPTTGTDAASLDTPAAGIGEVRRFTIGDTVGWMEWSGTELADVVNEDETPGVKLGAVGFARAPKGASSTFEFAYDEVLVVTKGACTVRSRETVLTAQAGEVLYLPAGTPGSFSADEDVELVYVASSPYGEVNREAKASLLSEGEHPRQHG